MRIEQDNDYHFEKAISIYYKDSLFSKKTIGHLGDEELSGFDLENLPDRQQACTMIVRMLGETEAAEAASEQTVTKNAPVETSQKARPNCWPSPYRQPK